MGVRQTGIFDERYGFITGVEILDGSPSGAEALLSVAITSGSRRNFRRRCTRSRAIAIRMPSDRTVWTLSDPHRRTHRYAHQMTSVVRCEHPVVDRAVRQMHAFQLRDVDRRSKLHESRIDRDRAIRIESASRAADPYLCLVIRKRLAPPSLLSNMTVRPSRSQPVPSMTRSRLNRFRVARMNCLSPANFSRSCFSVPSGDGRGRRHPQLGRRRRRGRELGRGRRGRVVMWPARS